VSRRRLYLDPAPGEDRAVVTLDGRPERLLRARADDPADPPLGARYAARLARIDRGLACGFLDLGEGAQALLALSGPAKTLAEGAALEIEIAAESRRGKLAQARLIGAGLGPARRLDAPVTLLDRLRAFAPDEPVIEGDEARERADEADAEILAIEHPLPGAGSLSIEPTRALTAIDVDLGARTGDAKRLARQANLTAIHEAARLLRLKGLGGLVVIDLVGEGHDGAALTEAARAAFAPDQPGVVLGPVSRLGLFQLATPRRVQPLSERLCDETGALSAASLALRLLRALEREGRADRGARLLARCAPPVAEAALAYARPLTDSLGPRFEIRADSTLPALRYEVSAS